MAESRRTGDPLPAVLRAATGCVGEKDLTAAIAETVGLRFIDFTEHPLHPDAAMTVPEAVAREHLAIGVDFEGTRLVVAFTDPGDDAAVQAVGRGDRLRDHPRRRRPLRDPARDRLGVRPRPQRRAVARGAADGARPGRGAGGHPRQRAAGPVLEQGGSDLHLTAGSPPVIRVHGELRPLAGHRADQRLARSGR